MMHPVEIGAFVILKSNLDPDDICKSCFHAHISQTNKVVIKLNASNNLICVNDTIICGKFLCTTVGPRDLLTWLWEDCFQHICLKFNLLIWLKLSFANNKVFSGKNLIASRRGCLFH